MWDKLGTSVGLVIGVCLIIFKKRFADLIIRKQLEERVTPKRMGYHQQLKEMKFEGILHKGLEIAAIVFGAFVVLMSISKFSPQVDKYIRYFIAYSMLAFFAACVAAFVEFLLLFRFLWRNVHGYARQRYGDWYQSVQGSDKLNAVSAGPTDDPVLRALQKKATIHSAVCFVVLFVIFLFAFFTIFRLTS